MVAGFEVGAGKGGVDGGKGRVFAVHNEMKAALQGDGGGKEGVVREVHVAFDEGACAQVSGKIEGHDGFFRESGRVPTAPLGIAQGVVSGRKTEREDGCARELVVENMVLVGIGR